MTNRQIFFAPANFLKRKGCSTGKDIDRRPRGAVLRILGNVFLLSAFSLMATTLSSCIPRFGKSNASSQESGTSFGVAIPVPAAVAARMGYSGLFQLNAHSSTGQARTFERVVSLQGGQAGQVVLDRDNSGQYLQQGEALSHLVISLHMTSDRSTVYSGGANQENLVLAKGINRIAFSMACQAPAICDLQEKLVVMPVTPPRATAVPEAASGGEQAGQGGSLGGGNSGNWPAAGASVGSNGSGENGAVNVRPANCKCGLFQNSCMVWIPGQPKALESKAATSCKAEFCRTGFSAVTYKKCGGAAAVIYTILPSRR